MHEISTRLSNALKTSTVPLLRDLNSSFCYLRPYGRNAGPSLIYDIFFPIIGGAKILGDVLAIILCAACIVFDICIMLPSNILFNVLTLDDGPKNNLFPTASTASILSNLSFMICATIDIVSLATAIVLTPLKMFCRGLSTLVVNDESDKGSFPIISMPGVKPMLQDLGIVPSIACNLSASYDPFPVVGMGPETQKNLSANGFD
jgi:hypothetical protein